MIVLFPGHIHLFLDSTGWLDFNVIIAKDRFNFGMTYNYQVSKEVVRELEFGDIAVMQI